MKLIFSLLLFLCSVLHGQAPFNATNIRLSNVTVQGTPASVARIFTLATNGTGETVTPTNLWSAVVLTGTVDSTDLADGTTVGRSVFTLTNPSAITFFRINANNTVTARTAVELKTDLSLENVNNTSDANKPVSTATQTALNLKADLASPSFSGRVSAVNLRISGMESYNASAGTLVSGTTIAPTQPVTFISGTTTIETITVPTELQVGGGQIILIPTGVWATNTNGNIALGSTAVVNKILILYFDVATNKWYPSY